MCGIAGFIQRQPPDDAVIEEMIGALAHRGPDGVGVWRAQWNGWHIALAHARLAIIDLAGGHQPMANEDGRVRITYNGEVYAFQEMRRALEKRGHRFRTHSDTEVVLHHLEDAPTDPATALSVLDGMFALALWDQRRGRLLLARDRVGIKPLYYTALPEGGVAFASELTALLKHPHVRRDIDPDALASFFFMDYAMAPGSMIQGVKKLEPAKYAVWHDGQLSHPGPYWSPHGRVQASALPNPQHAPRLCDLLEEAVESRLVADVPVGLFLSGGIDSSIVGALASRRTAKRLKTFTIRMEDPEFDQSADARQVAAHIGSEHIEEQLSGESLLDDLDAALGCLDEPLADPSLLPTYVLSRLAARHVKVVLGGDGADELWGGYPTLRAHSLAQLYGALPRAFRRRVVEPLVRALPVRHGYQSLEWKAKRFAHRWEGDPARRHLRWMSSLDLQDLAEATASPSALPSAFAPLTRGPIGTDLLNDILRLDFQTYLPGAVLAKVDRASMAHGLEVRPPLLSNVLIDLAMATPSSLKVRGRRTKMPLRSVAAGLLPRAAAARPKRGFAIPLARWLLGPLRERLEEALGPGPIWDQGLLEHSAFVRWQQDHQALRADRSRPLWALIVLDHWLRRVRHRPPTAPAGRVGVPTTPSSTRRVPCLSGGSGSRFSPLHVEEKVPRGGLAPPTSG
jgi:asparagine synthase (glutamine-hydrolysing)